ncbi:acyltransferase [Flavobacterium silvisoli]|uniref:Acyltransferase n=1 Tax=Flavobacterium silvisoli TaxID=2529433 RepID=A0A4Q9Z4Z2_9FLAO|nr:acyltransferase [Flavobacterium silvisoli]TBX71230.1 acyltransferase [Flavobacterium silvisoli]
MIKGIFQKMLASSGKSYQIDERIPAKLMYSVLFSRLIMLIRGYLKTGRKIFVGSNTRILNSKNIVFGKSVTIGNHCVIDGFASEKIVLGDCVKIGCYSKLLSTSHFSKFGKGLKMGNNSAIGDFTHFGAPGGIEIGNDVIMGSYISFHSENHNFNDTTKLIREQGTSSKGIKLGNNIWVGAKVTFLDGCEVGDNSVVAAGAVVNGVYPNNSIIGGVPAKVIKKIE